MVADPNIFQQYMQPVRSINDYLGDMDKRESNAISLISQRRQNDLAGLQFNQTQQALADAAGDKNALQRVAARWTSDTTPDERVAALRNTGRPGLMSQADALEKAAIEQTKGKAVASKDQAEADTKGFDLHQKKATQAITDIANLGSAQDALASLNSHLAAGDIDQQKHQSVLSTLQPALQDPAQFGQWKRQMILGILDAKDRAAATAPKITMVNAGGSMVPTNTNADAGPVGAVPGAAPIQVTQSPDSIATNARIAAEGSANRATTMRGQNLSNGLDPKGRPVAGDSPGGISPAAIENAAARYNIDGTIPPLGMGAAAGAVRQAILNRAAELNAGVSGEDARINQIGGKNASQALGQLGRSKAMNAAFEKTANANADLALGLSDKMDRTGVPLINAGIQAYRTGTGSPEATQFAAANQTFVSEYAKIMSGGMGNGPVSDAARSKAEKLLTTSMTPVQYRANVKLLQTEMKNRMKGFDDQEAELRGSMRRSPPASGGSGGDPSADIHAQADAILRGGR
jgi:hypothetical protein